MSLDSYYQDNILGYILNQLAPSVTDTIYDPCMNAGNFIIYYISYMKNKYNICNNNINNIIYDNITGCEANTNLYNIAINNICTHILNENTFIKLYNIDCTNIDSTIIQISYNIIFSYISDENININKHISHILNRLDKHNGRGAIIISNYMLYCEDYHNRKKILDNFNIVKIVSITSEDIFFNDKSILFFNNISNINYITYCNLSINNILLSKNSKRTVYDANLDINYNENIITHQYYSFIKELDYIMIPETSINIKKICLSPLSIIALDIIKKEYLNMANVVSVSNEDNILLLNNILKYLHEKETYILSYVSKKAIDIIKLDYIISNNELDIIFLKIAIKNQLNNININININNYDTNMINTHCPKRMGENISNEIIKRNKFI